MIEQADVDAVLNRGREFYKYGLKTTNKFYRYPVLEKHFRRARSTTPETGAMLGQQRATLQTGSRVDYGQTLYENSITLGNCGEMTGVIAWLVKTSPELAGKVTMSIVGYTQGNRNHYFNIVIDRTATWPPPFQRIDQIANLAAYTNGIWVIDLWSKLACPIADYPRLVREKANLWMMQTKWINHPTITLSDGSTTDLSTARQFVDFVATQTLFYEYL